MKKTILSAIALLVPVALIWFSRVGDVAAMVMFLGLSAVIVSSFELYEDSSVKGAFWVALVGCSVAVCPMLGLARFFYDTPQLHSMMLLSGAYVCFVAAVICVLRLNKNIWLSEDERRQTWRILFVTVCIALCLVGAVVEMWFNITLPAGAYAFIGAVAIVESLYFIANYIYLSRTKKAETKRS